LTNLAALIRRPTSDLCFDPIQSADPFQRFCCDGRVMCDMDVVELLSSALIRYRNRALRGTVV
jgi:hypothetical protein